MAFLPAIGASLAGAGAAVSGAIGGSAATAAIVGAGAGMGLSRLMSSTAKAASASPASLPQAPTPEASQDKALESAKRRRASATQTMFTSPLGVQGTADIARKSLLGQ